MEKTVFETLSSINVNDKVEKKNNLTYLSWAWAWAEVKKIYPDAKYEVIGDTITKKPYFFDENLGYMVVTEVTINGETLSMWLPVMDGANKAMKDKPYTYKGNAWVNGKKVEVEKEVEAASMFDINKTLMRCLTKNLAMFGLGLYIYAGEDLPESENAPVAPQNVELPKKADVAKQRATTPPATPATPAEAPAELPLLVKDSEDWTKVVDYVTANKDKGLERIGKQLNRRFKISPALKKEIAKLIE